MSETSYTVRAKIVVDASRISDAKSKINGLGGEAKKVGGAIEGSIGGGIVRAFRPLMAGGAVAVGLGVVLGIVQRIAGTFSGMFRSVADMGGTLEQTKLGLAQALSEGFDLGFDEAGVHADAMFDRLRKRARDMSVGSLSDVINVARDVTAPGARAGMGSGAVEDLAFNSTALGRMWGFDAGAIGESIRRALDSGEVAAGRDSVVSRALGGKAGVQRFSKIADPGERAKVLAEAFASASTVLGAASQTWASSWGTLWDILDEAREAFGAIAFEGLKETVADLNNALIGGGLADAAHQMGSVVNALMAPFRWLATGVIEVAGIFQAIPAWGDYLALTFSEIGDDLTEFGEWIGDIGTLMAVGLLPVITLLGTALVGLTKGIRIIVQGIVSLVDLLWQVVKWVASWVPGMDVQTDFGGALDRYVDGIEEIFRVERRQRDDAAKKAKDLRADADKNNKLQVELKLSQKVEWGDDRSLVAADTEMLTQLVEQVARYASESSHGRFAPRYA